MKASKKEIGLLLGLLGVLLGVGVYFLYFSSTQEKSDALEAENTVLRAQIDSLEQLNMQSGTYESEIARMSGEIDDVMNRFPVDVREEDCILLAINEEIGSPMSINALTINPKVAVDFRAEAEASRQEHLYDYDDQLGELAPEEEETTTEYSSSADIPGFLESRQMTMNYLVDYQGLKKSVDMIKTRLDKSSLESINLAYDESTGLLSGNATINMYCIPYQDDKEYKAPDFSAVLLGTDNIFGTLDGSILLNAVTDAVNGALNDEDGTVN